LPEHFSDSADRPVTAASIRTAGVADAGALARLRYEFRVDIASPAEAETAFVERCREWMARRLEGGQWRCWIAEADRIPVGTAWLHLFDKLPNPVAEPERHGYITSLYVRPAYRGTGLGSALLAACLDGCRSAKVDAVLLWPTPASRSLYLRHGFDARDDVLELRLWQPPLPAGAA
jgi:GNAT superfamily N-acetyltransferase